MEKTGLPTFAAARAAVEAVWQKERADGVAAVQDGRFPAAEERFALADFVLFRFEPSEARWVGGFARALRMTGAQLTEALREAAAG